MLTLLIILIILLLLSGGYGRISGFGPTRAGFGGMDIVSLLLLIVVIIVLLRMVGVWGI
jgi:hypothetical protein